jgi:hypothetical protein
MSHICRRRSFAQWPYGSSSMNLTPLLKCWLATMCPWQSQSQSSASSSSNQGYGQQRDGAGVGSPASTLQHTLQSVRSLGDSLQSRLAGSREGTPEPQARQQQQQPQQVGASGSSGATHPAMYPAQLT